MTPLPTHKYIPGQTVRHADGAFEAIRDRALRPTSTQTAEQNPPWLYGKRLLRAAFYWEAHEVWEPVWLNAPPNSAERFMCQAVIQLANAALKCEMGKAKAALRLCDLAEGLLTEAQHGGQANPMGVEPTAVQRALAHLRDDGAIATAPPGFII